MVSGSVVVSFQKIYDLYGLKHHSMEINGDVTMETNEQTNNRKVKIGLVSKLTEDCWTADFRNLSVNNNPSVTSALEAKISLREPPSPSSS